MSKHPKPWSRVRRGRTYWYVTLDGKQHSLGTDRDKAFRLYHDLMARGTVPQVTPTSYTLQELAGHWWDHLKATGKPRTAPARREELARAFKYLDKSTPADQLRKLHLSRLEASLRQAGYSVTTVHHTLAAVKTLVSWAHKNDYVSTNPLVGYTLPQPTGRTATYTAAQRQALLRGCSTNRPLQRLVLAAIVTGCRPGELRQLRWSDVELDAGVWVIRDHKTSTTRSGAPPRVVPLPWTLVALCRWLSVRRQSENVFVNADGEPWKKDTLCQAIRRARRRADLPASLTLYNLRHTFATEALGKVSDIELAEIMGHSNTRTLRRYTHLDLRRIGEIRRRIG